MGGARRARATCEISILVFLRYGVFQKIGGGEDRGDAIFELCGAWWILGIEMVVDAKWGFEIVVDANWGIEIVVECKFGVLGSICHVED